MRLSIALLLAVGCAHAHVGEWAAVPTCEPWPGVRVASESARCEAIAGAFDMAAAISEEEGIATRAELLERARAFSFVVLDVPHLYVNRNGNRVGGILACDDLPRVIMDRTLRGGLHEFVIHGGQCLRGDPLVEPEGAERSAWRRFWALGAWR